MDRQRKLKQDQASEFFADESGNRPPVPGALPYGPLESGTVVITRELLRKGQERYQIYCTVCHDQLGNGQGMAVIRGLARPPSFHQDSVRRLSNQVLFQILSHGKKLMPSFSAQLSISERWAVVSYIRALQLSRYAPKNLLSPDDLARLEKAQP